MAHIERSANHTVTFSNAIKPKFDLDGKKLRVILTHGWLDLAQFGRGRKVEIFHFANLKAAKAYAQKQGWL